MRCVDVIRELAAPTAGPEPVGLAPHLARCPQCAAWAERDARLGRLWNATRPVEPGSAEWDAVWARLSEVGAEIPARETIPFRPWGRAAVVLLGLAQAAALLFAITYSSRPNAAPPHRQTTRIAFVAQASQILREVEIDAGQLAVIVGDSSGVRVTNLALNENAVGVDPAFDGLNSLEAIARQ